MSRENSTFGHVCMGVAAVIGIMVALSVYSHGFFWIIAGVTAAGCVPYAMSLAESDGGEIFMGILGIFGGVICGVLVQYGFMLIWFIVKAVLNFGIGNTIKLIMAIPLLVIGFIIYCIAY